MPSSTRARPGRRAAQSVGLHLMTLCLVLEKGADPRDGPELHKRMIERTSPHWLEPPAPWGALTIADVAAARDRAEHDARVWSWSREVWRAWAAHHATVREWLARGLG